MKIILKLLLITFFIFISCENPEFNDVKIQGYKGKLKSVKTILYPKFYFNGNEYFIDSTLQKIDYGKYYFDEKGYNTKFEFSITSKNIEYKNNSRIEKNYIENSYTSTDTIEIIKFKDKIIYRQNNAHKTEHYKNGISIGINGNKNHRVINTDSTIIKEVYKLDTLYFRLEEKKLKFDKNNNPIMSISKPLVILKETLETDGETIHFMTKETLITYEYEYYE